MKVSTRSVERNCLFRYIIEVIDLDLSQVFSDVFYKRVARTELESTNNHQHELNASNMKRFFGKPEDSITGRIQWLYFSDSQLESEESDFTYYDSRKRHPSRSEWRLYYKTNFISRFASNGDLLIIARDTRGKLYGFIFDCDSTWFNSALTLFEISAGSLFEELVERAGLENVQLESRRKLLLEEAGLDLVTGYSGRELEDDADMLFKRFGNSFPPTREMSSLARQLVSDTHNPDDDLVNWISREEELFRALEKRFLQEKIEIGFADVDEFANFALSFLNRRKSRMGHALQNHLEAVFDNSGLRYESQVVTEGKRKPDFIFPNGRSYRNPNFESELLTFLGAKSSLKDRWRQILNEAARIRTKHLCTLQQTTSRDQLHEMEEESVILVVPEPLAYNYSSCNNVITLGEFITREKAKQKSYTNME